MYFKASITLQLRQIIIFSLQTSCIHFNAIEMRTHMEICWLRLTDLDYAIVNPFTQGHVNIFFFFFYHLCAHFRNGRIWLISRLRNASAILWYILCTSSEYWLHVNTLLFYATVFSEIWKTCSTWSDTGWIHTYTDSLPVSCHTPAVELSQDTRQSRTQTCWELPAKAPNTFTPRSHSQSICHVGFFSGGLLQRPRSLWHSALCLSVFPLHTYSGHNHGDTVNSAVSLLKKDQNNFSVPFCLHHQFVFAAIVCELWFVLQATGACCSLGKSQTSSMSSR